MTHTHTYTHTHTQTPSVPDVHLTVPLVREGGRINLCANTISDLKKNALLIFFKYKEFMKKKGHTPITRVKNPEPNIESPDWVIWAAWADRITFEEIEKKTGKTESEVIKIMRRSIKPSSFRLWRKRVNQKSIKHRKKFEYSRKQITSKIKKGDYL